MKTTISRGGGAVTAPNPDPRVVAVLEVLGGDPVDAVAARHQVESSLIQRWVRGFVDAGSAHLAQRPDPGPRHQRDRFLAAFAHETRTPLSIAQGWLSVVDVDSASRDDLREAVVLARGAVERLSERLLDIELLVACSLGRTAVHPQSVPVEEIGAGLPGLDGVRIDRAPAAIVADPKLFDRVLRDQWWAAGVAPAPRGRTLEVELTSPWVEVRIRRDGEPIGCDVLQALFDPFDVNDDTTGVTFGLYLARSLAVAHGGTIGVDQDERGTTLWVRLPHPSDPEAV